jgi:hypothetical protein
MRKNYITQRYPLQFLKLSKDLVLRLLKKIIFDNYDRFYIHQSKKIKIIIRVIIVVNYLRLFWSKSKFIVNYLNIIESNIEEKD